MLSCSIRLWAKCRPTLASVKSAASVGTFAGYMHAHVPVIHYIDMYTMTTWTFRVTNLLHFCHFLMTASIVKIQSYFQLTFQSFNIHWNLSWETTVIRGHLSWTTRYSWQQVPHFSTTETKTTSLERPHVYGKWGGLSRLVVLYIVIQFVPSLFRDIVP